MAEPWMDRRRTRSERPDDPRLTHGSHGSYNRGCGCPDCREGEARYQAARRRAREQAA